MAPHWDHAPCFHISPRNIPSASPACQSQRFAIGVVVMDYFLEGSHLAAPGDLCGRVHWFGFTQPGAAATLPGKQDHVITDIT